MSRPRNAAALFRHIFGTQEGVMALTSFTRPSPDEKKLRDPEHRYFNWPNGEQEALSWSTEEALKGREVYFCAHLLTSQRRIKLNAAPISTLYADGDGAEIPHLLPQPTAVVESSPGRQHYYWRLSRPIDPEQGEKLNKRIAHAINADKSGSDLTQILRVPDTLNHKYDPAAPVELRGITETAHAPEELDRLLPQLPETPPKTKPASDTLAHSVPASLTTDEVQRRLNMARVSKASEKFKMLYDKGYTSGYTSRSEAHMALMGHLAFWLARDIETMVQAFKHSALWENSGRTEDYLRKTAEKAAENCTKVYTTHYKPNGNIDDTRESLRVLALTLPWEGQGGPTDFAVYWALINTEGARSGVEGLISAPGIEGLSMATGGTRVDTVRASLKRLEDERGLIKRMGRSRSTHADRFLLLLNPAHTRDTRINLSPCVTSCITALCRIRNPAPQTEKTFDRNGRRIPQASSSNLKLPFGKLRALTIAKVLAYGRLHKRELWRSLERRGDSMERRNIPALLKEGFLLAKGDHYVAPLDAEERVLRELEETGCIEKERASRRRFELQRQRWDEERLLFLYGDSPEEDAEVDIRLLVAQGEAERREEEARATLSPTTVTRVVNEGTHSGSVALSADDTAPAGIAASKRQEREREFGELAETAREEIRTTRRDATPHRDPLAHRGTEKADWYRMVKEEDDLKRREGTMPAVRWVPKTMAVA